MVYFERRESHSTLAPRIYRLFDGCTHRLSLQLNLDRLAVRQRRSHLETVISCSWCAVRSCRKKVYDPASNLWWGCRVRMMGRVDMNIGGGTWKMALLLNKVTRSAGAKLNENTELMKIRLRVKNIDRMNLRFILLPLHSTLVTVGRPD